MTARAWCTTAGNLDHLVLKEKDVPVLEGPDHILVKVENCGVNFADIFACLGLYSATPKGEFTPGLEFCGVIEEIYRGEGITHSYKKGDKVMGVTRFGGYSTHIVSHFGYVRYLPDGWTFKEGAAFLCKSLTAWYGLVHLGGLTPPTLSPSRMKKALGQEIVLIQSAAGGVGLWALNICRLCGAFPVAVVGTQEKKEFLVLQKGLNENQVIVRGTGNEFQGQIKTVTDWIQSLPEFSHRTIDGVSIVFDAVAGDYFTPSYQSLCRGGKYVIYGAAQYMSSCGKHPNYITLGWKYMWRPKLDPMEMITENKSVHGFNLIWLWDKVELMEMMLSDMMEKENDWDKPYVPNVFSFEETLDGLLKMQRGETMGNLVLDIK